MASLLTLAAVLLLLAACEDFGDQEPEADAEPSPTVEPVDESSVAGVDEDPVDVLFELFEATENEDYRTVYDRLVSDFHIVEFDEDADERQQWMMLVSPRNHYAASERLEHPADSPASWRVDEHDGFVIVRHRDVLGNAFVFRPENGEWRLDPGEINLVQAWERSLPETERGAEGFMNMPEHYEVEFSIEGVDQFPLHSIVTYSLYTFTVHDGYADATFRWDIRQLHEMIGDFDEYLYHDFRIPLDGLTWSLDGETGPVEVVWTNAVHEDDHLVLPANPEWLVDEVLEARSMPSFGMFGATLRLQGLPDDVDETDEVVLRTEDVQIGPMGEGAPAGETEPLRVTWEHRIPMTSSTDILAGNAPESAGDTPSREDVDSMGPEDVPPGPDPTELLSIIDVEYEQVDDQVTALITLDTGDTQPTWEREVDVDWSDGETTIWAPEAMSVGEFTEIEAQRSNAPEDVEVHSLRFGWLEFNLEADPDAMVFEDRIETKWGDFPIVNIVEGTDGSATVYYEAAGRRWIRQSSMEHGGRDIRFSTTAMMQGDDLVPQELQMQFGRGFVEALDNLPLPAEVTVRELAGDVVIEVEE